MLKVEGLQYTYNKSGINSAKNNYIKIPVIKGISFQVKEGELVCLLGPNGSGKTTILKCLNGVLQPEQGKIFLKGKEINSLRQKEIARLISMVPQEHNTIFSYHVLDLVLMGLTPCLSPGRLPSRADKERAVNLLEKLGVSHLTNRSYNQLSGGEKQLILVARALIQGAPFLAMDEPTSYLDFRNQHLILQELKKLSREGKGIITALHDPNLALRFADRVIILKEGIIIKEGKTDITLTDKNLEKAYDIQVRTYNRTGRGIEIILPEIL